MPQPKNGAKAPSKQQAAPATKSVSLRDRVRQRRLDGKVFIIPADAEFEVLEDYANNAVLQVTCTNGRVIEFWESWLEDEQVFTELEDGSLQLNNAENKQLSVSEDGVVQKITKKPRKAKA